MSAGPGPGSPGPVTPRPHVLARLEAERRQAAGCFEWRRVAELDAQIASLSRGTPESPRKETAARKRKA